MPRLPGYRLALCLLAPGSLAVPAAASPTESSPGVVVEQLVAGGVADRAGLRRGDVLLGWRRAAQPPANPEPAAGLLESPLDVEELEVEQAPRGPVSLSATRDGQPLRFEMAPGEWLVTLRPPLSGDELAAYQRALRTVEAGELAAGTAGLLDLAERSTEPEIAASLVARVEDLWFAERLWPHQERLDRWLASAPLLQAHPHLRGVLAVRRAVRFEAQIRWDDSVGADDEALRLLDAARPDSLRSAHVLFHRAPILRRSGDALAYRSQMHQAARIIEVGAPDSLLLARARTRLTRGGLELGWEARVAACREALALADRLAPESLEAASIAGWLGILLHPMGAFAEVEALYRRVLATRERLASGSFEHAAALLNLGNISSELGNDAMAEELFSYALDLTQRHRLGPSLLGVIQANMAGVLERRGRLSEARDLYSQSVANAVASQPRNTAAGIVLINRARLEFALGDGAAARSALNRYAAMTADGVAFGGYIEASAQRLEGQLALARSDHEAARAFFQRALELDSLLAPDCAVEAEDLALLADLANRQGQTSEALRFYERALRTLENHRSRTSSDPTRSASFVSRHFDLYSANIAALVAADRPEEAFAVLERSRGRALREQLTEREASDDGELAPQLAAERREAESAYARARAALAGLAATAPASERDPLRDDLIARRLALEKVVEQVRLGDPRLAALQYPQALDLAAVQAGLDPGTLLLAYSVGESEALLFVVPDATASTGLAVHRVPIGRTELRRRVEAFRAVTRADTRHPAAGEMRTQAKALFDLLLRPAWATARGARRLLISPDDALAGLPFATLREGDRYLAELKATHTTVSTTLYLQQRADRTARATASAAPVIVFGDPLTTSASIAPLRGSGALRSLGALGRLPGARREAERVAQVFPEATTYLGADATETRARALPRQARLVHFACHAVADPSSPMHSALVLSSPKDSADADADGLLEAWEIMAHMRVDADLVTLSACQTALGQAVAGEGPMGLTRAFLHAGARSVVSSLWQVPDDSTQELMVRFYRELRAGQPKDEALRRAQVALIRGRWKGPFHWAGFQLQGDWR